MVTTLLTLIGLFVLRIAVPLTVTLAVGEYLRRLDERWSKGHGLAA